MSIVCLSNVTSILTLNASGACCDQLPCFFNPVKAPAKFINPALECLVCKRLTLVPLWWEVLNIFSDWSTGPVAGSFSFPSVYLLLARGWHADMLTKPSENSDKIWSAADGSGRVAHLAAWPAPPSVTCSLVWWVLSGVWDYILPTGGARYHILTLDKILIKRRTNISFNALQTLILNLMIDNKSYLQLQIRPDLLLNIPSCSRSQAKVQLRLGSTSLLCILLICLDRLQPTSTPQRLWIKISFNIRLFQL